MTTTHKFPIRKLRQWADLASDRSMTKLLINFDYDTTLYNDLTKLLNMTMKNSWLWLWKNLDYDYDKTPEYDYDKNLDYDYKKTLDYDNATKPCWSTMTITKLLTMTMTKLLINYDYDIWQTLDYINITKLLTTWLWHNSWLWLGQNSWLWLWLQLISLRPCSRPSTFSATQV